MKIADFVLNLFFPKRCLFCNRVLGFTTHCECYSLIGKLTLEFEKKIDKKGTELCFVDKAFALYEYSGPVRASIISMKFNGHAEKALEYGNILGEKIKPCKIIEEFDIIVPIPSSNKTFAKRGYDVPRLLAKQISTVTLKPMYPDILYKAFDTKQQSHLSGTARRANLAGVFSVKNAAILQGKKVLLVDDVVTTGTTLNECAKTLLYAGAENVISVCIALASHKTYLK